MVVDKKIYSRKVADRMKWVVPHEHGAWAMLIVPFVLGMWAAGPELGHLFLFLAWLFFYCGTYSLIQSYKRKRDRARWVRWGVAYGLIGLIFLVYPLIVEPKLWILAPMICGLFSINFWYVTKGDERAIMNDLVAILVFSLGGVAAYLLGTGEWSFLMFSIYLFSVVYFMGSVFFVKSVIRERKNPRWLTYAIIYHVFLLLIPVFWGTPWLFLAFIASLIRLLIWGGKEIKPVQAGIIEMVNSLQFVLIVGLLLF